MSLIEFEGEQAIAFQQVCEQRDIYALQLAVLRELTQWRTMDSAPKDGTEVLLLIDAEESGDGSGQNYNQYVIQGFHSARAWRTQHHVTAVPLYWQPLPPAPPGVK